MEEMQFEMAMRAVLGDKIAYHCAGAAWDPILAKGWMRRALKQLRKSTLSLDTTERHRSIIIHRIDRLEGLLKKITAKDDPRVYKVLVWEFFNLTAVLYGYVGFVSPTYWQSAGQHFVESGYDLEGLLANKENIVLLQKEIIQAQLNIGQPKENIALAMNMTERKLNKILKEA